MNKAELIERIVDTFTGMGSEDPIDTARCNYLTLEEAKTYLDEYRAMEKADFEPDEWLPEEVTPELWMEANNCYIRKCKHDVIVNRLATWLLKEEPIAFYDDYRDDYNKDAPEIVPLDFWYNYNSTCDLPFGFGDKLTILDAIELIEIGMNSRDVCKFTDNYIYYDKQNQTLRSCNRPFGEAVISAIGFAKFILETPDALSWLREHLITAEDRNWVFEMEDK
jgi:hypothetical protein